MLPIKKNPFLIGFVTGLIFLTNSCAKDQGEIRDTSCDNIVVKYSTDIQPIIQNSACAGSISCHFTGSAAGDFTVYEGVKSKVDNGSMIKRVFDGQPSFMPPSGPLPDSSLKKIYCWIKAGAPNN